MRLATMADHLELYLREVGYGILDVGTCAADPDDGAETAGALGVALRQRLTERGVL
jgi:hypothetical protein